MQMVKNILISLLLAWFAILMFMPKKQLYYKLERELARQDIVLNEKSIDEGIFSLVLNQPSVYVKGIKVATLDSINFFTLLFYTKVNLQKFLLDDALKESLPVDIDKMTVSHAPWHIKELRVDANSSIGKIIGNIDLSKRSLRVDINTTNDLGMLKSELKQDAEGWYYETSF